MKNIFLFLLMSLFSPAISAKVQVAATTMDIAALVKEVGQNQVDVFAIAKGTQDPHQIEAKPSFMVKLRTADVVVAHGLELESAWLDLLIQGARNPKLTAKGSVLELAGELDPIETLKGNISRGEGHVHPGGNPHFQLDPIRLGKAAMLIADKLSALEPSQKDFFIKNAETFQKHMETKANEWQARLRKAGVTEFVTYHKYFAYFCARFGLECQLQLEPKPGIPPTASHLMSVIDQMKKRKLRVILIENIYHNSVGEKIRTEIPNAHIERVPVSVGGESGVTTNEQLIERIVKSIEEGSK